MNHIIEILLVFAFCSTAGWLLEVMYRSAVHRHFVNPGFLTGCALPIYGFGGLALYLLCLPVSTINQATVRGLFLFVGGALVMTSIELVGGLFLKKVYHLALWDYSDRKFQYKGIICLRFSLYWGICCLLFYLLLYPKLSAIAAEAIGSRVQILLLGFYYGIFSTDLTESLSLAAKLREHAKAVKTNINIERLKRTLQESAERRKKLLPLVFSHASIKDYLHEFRLTTQDKAEHLRERRK